MHFPFTVRYNGDYDFQIFHWWCSLMRLNCWWCSFQFARYLLFSWVSTTVSLGGIYLISVTGSIHFTIKCCFLLLFAVFHVNIWYRVGNLCFYSENLNWNVNYFANLFRYTDAAALLLRLGVAADKCNATNSQCKVPNSLVNL